MISNPKKLSWAISFRSMNVFTHSLLHSTALPSCEGAPWSAKAARCGIEYFTKKLSVCIWNWRALFHSDGPDSKRGMVNAVNICLFWIFYIRPTPFSTPSADELRVLFFGISIHLPAFLHWARKHWAWYRQGISLDDSVLRMSKPPQERRCAQWKMQGKKLLSNPHIVFKTISQNCPI